MRTPMARAMALPTAAMRRDDRHLADAAHAVGMRRIGHLDQDGLDHRQVGGDRHAVVEEARILELALGVVDVLLVQRPADALHGAALELALDVGRMDRRADVLRRGVAADGDAAGVARRP